MSITELYQVYLKYPRIQTDTRQLQAGDLFFALKGDRFDGNAFAAQALAAGAAAVIIDDPAVYIDERTIVVENVLQTLQQLALYHRQQFKIPFIAITGSNGKTTSKELVHAVLSTQFKTYTTQGNLNNHIGIPLTLLRVGADAEMAVIEMGANHQQEIAGYCQYVLPTHGIITNCGKAHLEGFGGVEGVKKGKGELFDFMRSHQGTAFVMWDYDYLRGMSHGISTCVTYGSHEADYRGEIVQGNDSKEQHLTSTNPFLQVRLMQTPSGAINENYILKTQLVGDYNFANVMLAVAVGSHFEVPLHKIAAAIEAYAPSNSRSQLLQAGSNTIILDAYNANPSSMRAAIENFARLQANKKVLLLGAMAELGNESLAEHRLIAALIAQYPWENVALVGGDFHKIEHPFLRFENAIAAGQWLEQQQFEHTHLLIKGSRSSQMELVLPKQ
ncbi:MAG: UDP-N-acetylmuramoyl-tripeptide--D-alanyl-D-alanine ligase [Sphingomonadales bacterium]